MSTDMENQNYEDNSNQDYGQQNFKQDYDDDDQDQQNFKQDYDDDDQDQQNFSNQQQDEANCPKYIRLRGLPWSATHQEILDFLKNINVVGGAKGIHLITSRWDGKNTGEAYVEVESQQDVTEASNLNKASMGHRYIEVFNATPKEAKEAMRKTGSHGISYVVKLRGLPYSVSEQQIEEFFNGLEIKPDREGILFVMDRRGRATGEAFVQFESQEDTEQALGRNREKIGHRYIEIFRSSLAELKRAANGNARPGPYDLKDRGGNRGNDFGGGRNNMRGNDWSNNGGGNGGYGVGANNTLGFNNLPNFTNSGNFGNGFGPNNNGGNFGNSGNFGNNTGGSGGNFGNNGNFGNGNNGNSNGSGFNNGGNNRFSSGGGGGGGSNSGNNSNFGNDFGDFGNFGNNRNFNDFGSNRSNSGNFGNFGNFGNGNNSNGGNNGNTSGGGSGGSGGGGFSSNNFSGNNFGPIGGGRNDNEYYTIHMRGLPYTSFENDVFKFFDPIRPANVRINFNNKGLHGGTADVYFDTYEDAQLAMKRNREQMGSRYIELFFDGKTKGGNNNNGYSRRI